MKTTDNLTKSQDVIGLAVFSVAEGQKLGIIKDIFLEPGKNSPLFLIEDEEWYKGGKVLKSCNIMKIGQDAMVIESKDKLEHFSKVSNIESMLRMNTDLTSVSVIDSAQKKLGNLDTYFIDRDKIEVVGLDVQNGGAEPKFWPAEKISGVKDGAVVMLDEEQSDEAVAETEVDTEPEGLIPETEEKPREQSAISTQQSAKEEKVEEKPEEKVIASGSHPEQVVDRREDLSKKVSNGNGETKEVEPKDKFSDKEPKAAVEDEPKVSEPSVAHKDLKEILEERQDKFLLGKKVDRDITTDDGTLIIQKGETITKEVLEEAKKAHKYIVLSFCVKTDLAKRS